MLRWLIATLHLLTLPLGLGAIWARSRALSLTRSADDLHRVFVADNLWGLAAVLWLVTGLLRVFAGLEKGTSYYLHDRRSEEHTSELQSRSDLVCRLLLEKKNTVTAYACSTL